MLRTDDRYIGRDERAAIRGTDDEHGPVGFGPIPDRIDPETLFEAAATERSGATDAREGPSVE